MKNDKAAKPRKSLYKRLSFEKKTAFWGVIFLLPWLIGLILFFLVPLVQMVWYSLCSNEMTSSGLKGTFIGLDNFKYALNVDPDFNKDLLTALKDVALNVPIQIFVSLFIAILLNGKYKGRGFFRAIFFIPIILATGVTTVELRETSLLAEASESVMNMEWMTDLVVNSGIPQQLTSLITTYISSIFEVVTTSGVQILIFLSGLQAISPTLYEVAQLEGCTTFETFCKITLPMISPMILVCLVYSISEVFAKADISETISDITFAGTATHYGYGAAMSMIYFVVAIVCIGVVCGIVSKGVFYYDN